jgi:hypothetical protein
MRSFVVVVGTALMIAACSAAPSSTANPAPSIIGGLASIGPSVLSPTPRPTPTPVPIASCPKDSPLTVAQFADADPACFAEADVTVRGWLDQPLAIGFSPPGIEPSWLFYPRAALSMLWQAPPNMQGGSPDGTCAATGGAPCAWLIWHRDPAATPTLQGPPRWLLATGHTFDALAETCHYDFPADWVGDRPDDAEAVQSCREGFVIVSFRDAP